MKKILGVIIVITVLVMTFVGCVDQKNNNKIKSGTYEDAEFWQTFYKSNQKRQSLSESATYTKASYGYVGGTTQGFNRWYYLEENASGKHQMTYDTALKGFSKDGTTMVGSTMISAGESYAVRDFKVTLAGEATICGNIATLASTSCKFAIYKNNTQIYPSTDFISLENDTQGIYYSLTANLEVDDHIYFKVKGSAECNPTIYYGEREEILYHVPGWNFWGDVHPYYYNGTMYMYNIQGYLEDVGNERLLWCLSTSTDMFNYEETDYEVFDFVVNHHNPSLYVYNSIYDKETFPYGNRDMFLFFDEGAQHYVYIGLCYYADGSSCMGCRVSDDDTGTKWTSPMFSIRDYAKSRDPECSQAIKIKDRWYLITSVWGESIHSVGRPTYYIGDAGKNFMENNWANKEPHYLDGEDLCAANFTNVGGDNWLMYGWIPKTSYGNNEDVYFDGTMDHGLWGGNINVPRELLQNVDGTLSTRLDSRVVELLDRGRLYSNDSPVSNETLGTFDRSFVQFDVDIPNDTDEVSYQMIAGEKTYKIRLYQKKSGAYMQVYCKQDTGHPLASELKIGESISGKHNFKIIVDHSVCEFYLDDLYTLTARISLFGGTHTSKVYADGSATFSNLTISKLANQEDVYD